MILPVDLVLPQLCESLCSGPNAVLVAAPGAGKTTRVPIRLFEQPWARAGRIILLSPRRVTARAAASRLAQQVGGEVGGLVGYRVRMDSRISAATRLEVVTEGVFTRMIQADPSLEGVCAVIFDEFHERSLDGDLGLALAIDAQQGLRPDLRLLVMSATLDARGVSALLGDCPVIQSEGRAFPVEISYLGRDPRAPVEDQTTAAVMRALSETRGDMLVFLPGVREIERTRERLEARLAGGAIDVMTLYGALDARAQDKAIAPSPQGRRKIVLATAIAETSLTIEGVTCVVDAGLSRRPVFEPDLGLSRLETVRASQASVTQRAGRAGRTGPGVCYRLWDAGETRALAPFDPPEILGADLSGLVLELAQWGCGPSQLRWMDAPPAAAWAGAVSTLQRLRLLDDDESLTARGRAAAGLPMAPRLAAMTLRAHDDGLGATAIAVAITLAEDGLGGRDLDLAHRLETWLRDRTPRAEGARGLLSRLCRDIGAKDRVDPSAVGAVLALGFPDRIARRRGGAGEALMANGRAVAFDTESALSRAEWTVVANATGRAQRTRVFAASAVDAGTMEQILAEQAVTAVDAVFDKASGEIRARRTTKLGAITVKESPEPKPDADVLRQCWMNYLAAEGFVRTAGFGALQGLLARMAFARRVEGEAWPAWTLETIADTAREWGDSLFGEARRLSDLDGDTLCIAVLSELDYAQRAHLDRLAPAFFTTPLGTRVPIDYADDGGPSIEVRMQELFGQTRHPSIADGKAPLLVKLLSPAQRPIQITRDLPGFWRGSYAAVRVEMKGRYPKHFWPDDPATAPPTRRTRPS